MSTYVSVRGCIAPWLKCKQDLLIIVFHTWGSFMASRMAASGSGSAAQISHLFGFLAAVGRQHCLLCLPSTLWHCALSALPIGQELLRLSILMSPRLRAPNDSFRVPQNVSVSIFLVPQSCRAVLVSQCRDLCNLGNSALNDQCLQSYNVSQLTVTWPK